MHSFIQILIFGCNNLTNNMILCLVKSSDGSGPKKTGSGRARALKVGLGPGPGLSPSLKAGLRAGPGLGPLPT